VVKINSGLTLSEVEGSKNKGCALMRKILAGAALFIVGIVCGLILTYGPLHAQGSTSEGDIMARLNEISRGQAEVVAAVNSMKEDIKIIKIRVTQIQ